MSSLSLLLTDFEIEIADVVRNDCPYKPFTSFGKIVSFEFQPLADIPVWVSLLTPYEHDNEAAGDRQSRCAVILPCKQQ
jgi:hypothetical protein